MTAAGKGTIVRTKALAVLLLGKLEASVTQESALEQLGDLMTDPEGNSSQLAAVIQQSYREAISLPSRIDSLHKLADTMRILATLEGNTA